jgi:cell division protein YceG involved in septum cleavage
MKTRYLISAVLVAVPMILGQVAAGEKELNKNQVPQAVIDAFEKAKGLAFEEEMFEGKAAYEVEHTANGLEYEFFCSAEGTVLQKEEEIEVHSLPKLITQAIMKAHPKAKIEEAEKLMKPDGTITGYGQKLKRGKSRT